MGKGKSKSGGSRNDNRKCGKAYKQRPRKQRKTGRTIGGYNDLMKNAFDFEYGRAVCDRSNIPYDVFARCEDLVIDGLYSAVAQLEVTMLVDEDKLKDKAKKIILS